MRKSTDSRPESVNANVLVQVCTVVQSDTFETLEVCRKLIKLGETATTLLFYTDLDFTYPPALQFNTLSNDLFLQAGLECKFLQYEWLT